MTVNGPDNTAPESLDDALTIINRQAEELSRLRQVTAGNSLGADIRRAVQLAGTINTLTAPAHHTELLEMIVNTAARVIGARAAALFMIDREASELIFEVATGSKADEVMHFRVPLGQGIAGLVAVTAQPMAVSDVGQDPRHASDIAESVGYQPESILCVPLILDGEVIGVLELLDRNDGVSFSPGDIELLDQFGRQAAVAIEQSRTFGSLTLLIGQALDDLGLIPDDHAAALHAQLASFTSEIESTAEFNRSVELARMVLDISSRGEAEHRLCREILDGISRYAASQATPWAGGFEFGP